MVTMKYQINTLSIRRAVLSTLNKYIVLFIFSDQVFSAILPATDEERTLAHHCDIKDYEPVFTVRNTDDLSEAIEFLSEPVSTATPEPVVPFNCEYLATWMLYYNFYLFEDYDYDGDGYYRVRYEYPYYDLYNTYKDRFSQKLGCNDDENRKKRNVHNAFNTTECDQLSTLIVHNYRELIFGSKHFEIPTYLASLEFIRSEINCPVVSLFPRNLIPRQKRNHESVPESRRTHFLLPDATYSLSKRVQVNNSQPIRLCGTYREEGELVRNTIIATPPSDSGDSSFVQMMDTSLSLYHINIVGRQFQPMQTLLSVSSEDGLSSFALGILNSNIAMQGGDSISAANTVKLRGYQLDITHAVLENHAGGAALWLDGTYQGFMTDARFHLSGNSTGILNQAPGGSMPTGYLPVVQVGFRSFIKRKPLLPAHPLTL